MDSYSFENFYDKSNLNKKFYKKFKKVYKKDEIIQVKKGLEMSKEVCLIKLMKLYIKTNYELNKAHL
jgi:hypothetical protein